MLVNLSNAANGGTLGVKNRAGIEFDKAMRIVIRSIAEMRLEGRFGSKLNDVRARPVQAIEAFLNVLSFVKPVAVCVATRQLSCKG